MISKLPYMSRTLTPNDALGFRAAGLLPLLRQNNKWLGLLGLETRKSSKFTFLGGKVERGETSLETAVREFYEESNHVLPMAPEACRDLWQASPDAPLLWIPPAKYVLHLLPLGEDPAWLDLPDQFQPDPAERVRGIAWCTLDADLLELHFTAAAAFRTQVMRRWLAGEAQIW